MTMLVLAAVVLLATHVGPSSTALRGLLAARLGERGFAALYSLVALASVAWLVVAYRDAPFVPLWERASWQAWVPLLAVPVSLVLLVAGVSTPNPTAYGGQERLRDAGARGVLRITRNPVMWGIGLWALAHLVPNGDLASVLFFGTFTVLALGGTLLIEARAARRHGDAWSRFAAATSNLPFAAVLSGRQSLGAALRETGWPRVAAAIVLYALLLHFHGPVIGVSPLPAG
jgi:uncharacterized membrane protein